MDFPSRFDVIVIGGGHAGTEAALAAARMGVKTLLLTHNVETLGQMSCNPAIGGIGKSHLVKEIDALGGAMALATDKGGIQFRVLNSRKGPAVRATRAQADRVLYKAAIREILENQANLWIFQQAADDLIVEQDQVKVVVSGSYSAPTRAAADVFQSAGIPYISAYAVHPDITRAGDYVFRTSFVGEVQGRGGAKLIGESLGKKRVVLIVLNNDFGQSLAGNAAAPGDVLQERHDVLGTFGPTEGQQQHRVVGIQTRPGSSNRIVSGRV